MLHDNRIRTLTGADIFKISSLTHSLSGLSSGEKCVFLDLFVTAGKLIVFRSVRRTKQLPRHFVSFSLPELTLFCQRIAQKSELGANSAIKMHYLLTNASQGLRNIKFIFCRPFGSNKLAEDCTDFANYVCAIIQPIIATCANLMMMS